MRIAPFVVVLMTSALAQDTLPNAAELLDGYERAAWRDVARPGAIVIRGKTELTLKIGARPPQIVKGQFEQYQRGTRYYAIADFGAWGRHEEGSDGEVVWEIDPNTGASLKQGEERAQELRLNAVTLGSWRDWYAAARTVGAREIDGVPCWSIVMQPKAGEGDAEVWYVGRDDARLRGMDLRVGPGKTEMELRLSDYERVYGVDLPRLSTMRFGVVTIAIHQDQVEFGAEIPDVRFALPQAIERLRQPPVPPQVPPPGAVGDGAAGGAASGPAMYEYTVTTVSERHAVAIRAKIKEAEIGLTLSVAFPEVMDYLNAQGVVPTGPPFTRYHTFAAEGMDLEAGMPVPTALAGNDRIKPVILPGGTVVTTLHRGPYQKLGNAYRALHRWLQTENRVPVGSPWEVYLTDPGSEPDPNKLTTQIFWPIEAKQ